MDNQNQIRETLVGLKGAFLIRVHADGRIPLGKAIAEDVTAAIESALAANSEYIDLGEADRAEIDFQLQVFMLDNSNDSGAVPDSAAAPSESIDELFADPNVTDE